ncbi:MAG: GGDEF domain-containing protein, partial [Cupriavidus sp.]|nr:GGDEF domain-containing protein [Cupriavidus sp.]
MTAFAYDVALAQEPAECRRPGVGPATDEAWALLEASGALAMRVDMQGHVLDATKSTADLLVYPREYLLRTS